MEPTWDLSIPSPLRLENLTHDIVQGGANHGANNCQNTTGRLSLAGSDHSISLSEPITPLSMKLGGNGNDQSPQSCNMNGHKSTSSSQTQGLSFGRQPRRLEIPKVFVAIKNCSSADLLELEKSVIATIEKTRENYICMHDVSNYVKRKVGITNFSPKWKYYDDRTFLFALQDRVLRDKFLAANINVLIGDTPVSFKAWQPYNDTVKKPCKFKVWLRITGLPVEHFCYNTAERVVCSFGRLFKCNMEKKETWLGCFYVMIDCPDIDEIKPRVLIQTDNDSEIPIFVDKMYGFPLDVYNAERFVEGNIAYDDILSALMDRGKITQL